MFKKYKSTRSYKNQVLENVSFQSLNISLEAVSWQFSIVFLCEIQKNLPMFESCSECRLIDGKCDILS